MFLIDINGGEHVEVCYREDRERSEEEKGANSGSQGKSLPLIPFYTPYPQNPKINPKSTKVHPDTQTSSLIKNKNQGLRLFCQLFSSKWIFDCGATDTMTFNPHDLCYLSVRPLTLIFRLLVAKILLLIMLGLLTLHLPFIYIIVF